MSRAKVIKVFLILFMLCMISSSGFADQNPINSEEEYEKHIKLAKEYFKEKQWDEAIEEYTNAISLKPDNAYLYYARGLSYYKNLI
jgi:tetratricopeptide (TPR) repeat protein